MATARTKNVPSKESYIVTRPITFADLATDEDPDPSVREFPTLRGAQTWMGQQAKEVPEVWDGSGQRLPIRVTNRGAGFSVLLKVVPRRGRPTASSISDRFPELGCPEPVRPGQHKEEWGDFLEPGPSELDGEVWLGKDWHFLEIAGDINSRPRKASVFGQVRFELEFLESSYFSKHRKLPPATFWASRQVRISLLIAARRHRSPEHFVKELSHLELNTADGCKHDLRAWNAFRWAVNATTILARNSLQRTSPEQRKEAAKWIRAHQKACNWTVEQLAEKSEQSVRQVHRHLAALSMPSAKSFSYYITAFKRHLKREIAMPEF